MRPWFERECLDWMDDGNILRVATVVIGTFPDFDDDGKDVRCHEVARAVNVVLCKMFEHRGFKFEVFDGEYGRINHSWIVYTKIGHDHVILDPYCPGRLPQVTLVDHKSHTEPYAYGAPSYKVGEPRNDINRELVCAMAEKAMPGVMEGEETDGS